MMQLDSLQQINTLDTWITCIALVQQFLYKYMCLCFRRCSTPLLYWWIQDDKIILGPSYLAMSYMPIYYLTLPSLYTSCFYHHQSGWIWPIVHMLLKMADMSKIRIPAFCMELVALWFVNNEFLLLSLQWWFMPHILRKFKMQPSLTLRF